MILLGEGKQDQSNTGVADAEYYFIDGMIRRKERAMRYLLGTRVEWWCCAVLSCRTRALSLCAVVASASASLPGSKFLRSRASAGTLLLESFGRD